MAPLSFNMAGVVLNHEVHGSHLDRSKNTTDEELEKRNFAAAGEQAASLWHGKEWGGHKIDAKYVHPPTTENLPVFDYPAVDQEWFARHAKYDCQCFCFLFAVVCCIFSLHLSSCEHPPTWENLTVFD